MKIALLKGGLQSLGGLEKTTVELAKSFAKRGEVFLLTSGPASEEIPGVMTISLCEKRKNTLQHLRAFDAACKAWLAKNPCDIVFGMERNSTQTHYRAGSGVHAAFLKKRALTDSWFKQMTFRWNPQHKMILSLEKTCMETTPIIFTNSEMVRREIEEHYKAQTIFVVHNGAPLNAWEENFKQTRWERASTPYRFLFVGQGFKRKGLQFLLRALSLLKSDYHLDVVGGDKEMSFYKRLCSNLRIETKVTFWGPQKNTIPFYQQADCLVIPSTYDPFANVTMEALSMGLFVVSSKFNGGSEVLDRSNGVVIDTLEDCDSLKESLERALLFPKTALSASNIRRSIQGLDISNQLEIIVRKTLETR